MRVSHIACSSTTPGVSDALRRSLRMLLKAHEYAHDARHADWDFAIEIQRLRATGISDCDLRWLICKGYVEHAGEVTVFDQHGRSFRLLTSLKFLDESCFVLTGEGVLFAEKIGSLRRRRWSSSRPHEGDVAVCCGSASLSIPFWDAVRLELWIGNQVVKRYRVPAPNQEIVLAAFEEEDWPERIDDPLAPAAEIDPKRRLHSTIQCLNRNQVRRLIHFRGDGHGKGVCWERVG